MAENKHQVGKVVNRPSGTRTGCRLLGLEGYFAIDSKNPLEPTNLCRIVLRANDNTNGSAINLTANIPIAEVPAIKELARIALMDDVTAKKRKFIILEGQAKPKVSDTNDEGTLVYSVEVAYDPARNSSITINVKNFRADVSKDAGGRLKYSSPKNGTQTLSYFLTARNFYNTIAHLDSVYNAWLMKSAVAGDFGESL